MADSVPVGTAVNSVQNQIARQKSGPKFGQKSALSDDVRLKLAQHISSELDIRHVLLIPGKRNKAHVMDELFQHINNYMTPTTITKPTLAKWLGECIDECVEWEAELQTEEKDGGSKKSGQDNIPDEPHKLAWVQLMREARVVMDREESFQKKKKPRFNGLTGKITTPSIPVPRPSIAGATAPTAAELIDVESAVNKEGCAESLAQALEIVTARKAAGLAANNLSYKSPPQRPDMVAEILSTMRAREERDNGLFTGVRRSMAYDQLPAARQRLADARADGDEEEITRATRALNKLRDEIDA